MRLKSYTGCQPVIRLQLIKAQFITVLNLYGLSLQEMSWQNENNAERIGSLAANFASLLERELNSQQETVGAMIEALRVLQNERPDPRFKRFIAELKKLNEQAALLSEMARRDYLAKIQCEAEDIKNDSADARLSSVLSALISADAASLKNFCDCLLENLLRATGAERGFILSYLPDAATADIIAARNYQTTNLSLAEYDFSRTLLREVFDQNASLLVADASHDARYAGEASVQRLELKSVIAAPLRHEGQIIGALYLENNRLPQAFDKSDLALLETIAGFVVFYFRHTRLLPIIFQQPSRVFLDASQVSKEFVSRDAKTMELLDVVRRIADSPATVLLEGESGTGKELIARALHYQSKRADKPFVAINCAAIPENLLESELFGHEKGAFTGANEKRIGLIEQANGGTLLLDEVSEIAYPLQAKLLRFLQGSEFQRLGGKELTKTDVRVLAATSKDLKEMTAAGQFQEALYFRLNVIPLRLPPLRERRDDIKILTEHFLSKFSALYNKKLQIEPAALECLREYDFPGNVRELENLIHRLVALSKDDFIRLGDLPAELLQMTLHNLDLQKDSASRILAAPPLDIDELRRRRKALRQIIARQERELVEKTVRETGGSLTEAASRLGIHRVTLHKILKSKW